MSIQKILTTDTLGNAIRSKYNETVDEIVSGNGVVESDGLVKLPKYGGGFYEIDLRPVFYPKSDVNNLVITPVATETTFGTTRRATLDDVINGIDETRFVSSAKLKYKLEDWISKDLIIGDVASTLIYGNSTSLNSFKGTNSFFNSTDTYKATFDLSLLTQNVVVKFPNKPIIDLATTENSWQLGGNTVGSEKTIGTIDNYDFPIIRNNTQVAKFVSGGVQLPTISTLGITPSQFAVIGASNLIQQRSITNVRADLYGTGTTNYLPKRDANNQLVNSAIIDSGTEISIGLTTFIGRLNDSISSIDVGSGRISDGIAYIDLIGDKSNYSDYGLRIIRNISGNGDSKIEHRGLSNFSIIAVENSIIDISTNNIKRFEISSNGANFYSGALGTSVNNTVNHVKYIHSNSNVSTFSIYSLRNNNGNGWDSETTYIQKIIDVTPMAYIAFNPSGGSGGTAGLAFGTGFGGSEIMRITNIGRVGIKTNEPLFDLHVNGSSSVNSIKIVNGAVSGYILQSDSSGNASWVAPVNSGLKGSYSIVNNTPALVNGTGTTGDWYMISDAGTRNFGNGNQTAKAGDFINYNGSVWTVISNTFSMPTASNSVLGAIRIGSTLVIDGGGIVNLATITQGSSGTSFLKVKLDAYGRVEANTAVTASDIPSLDWSKITTGKPTTLSGYGITDAVPLSNISGTKNYYSKFTSSNSIGNSVFFENIKNEGSPTAYVDYAQVFNIRFGDITTTFTGIGIGLNSIGVNEIVGKHQWAGFSQLNFNGNQLNFKISDTDKLIIDSSFIDIKNRLKFNTVSGTNKQVISTNGTNDVWVTLDGTYIAQSSDYRFVTDTEKATWNAKLGSSAISGTLNYIPKFSGTNTVGNSLMYEGIFGTGSVNNAIITSELFNASQGFWVDFSNYLVAGELSTSVVKATRTLSLWNNTGSDGNFVKQVFHAGSGQFRTQWVVPQISDIYNLQSALDGKQNNITTVGVLLGSGSALSGLTSSTAGQILRRNLANNGYEFATLSSTDLPSHTHTFASLTSKPTTITGYGITDFNSTWDARWETTRKAFVYFEHSVEIAQSLTVNTDLYAFKKIYDSELSEGTSGQYLSSTGIGTKWINGQDNWGQKQTHTQYDTLSDITTSAKWGAYFINGTTTDLPNSIQQGHVIKLGIGSDYSSQYTLMSFGRPFSTHFDGKLYVRGVYGAADSGWLPIGLNYSESLEGGVGLSFYGDLAQTYETARIETHTDSGVVDFVAYYLDSNNDRKKMGIRLNLNNNLPWFFNEETEFPLISEGGGGNNISYSFDANYFTNSNNYISLKQSFVDSKQDVSSILTSIVNGFAAASDGTVLKKSGSGFIYGTDNVGSGSSFTLTTNGKSGVATYSSNVLNIPEYIGENGGTIKSNLDIVSTIILSPASVTVPQFRFISSLDNKGVAFSYNPSDKYFRINAGVYADSIGHTFEIGNQTGQLGLIKLMGQKVLLNDFVIDGSNLSNYSNNTDLKARITYQTIEGNSIPVITFLPL